MERTYAIEVAETADLEADQIFLWIQQRSLDGATRWYRGLLNAYSSLEYFPYRFPATHQNPDVRRMLYGNFRILYRVVEPHPASEDNPKVRILHIHHTCRQEPSGT